MLAQKYHVVKLDCSSICQTQQLDDLKAVTYLAKKCKISLHQHFKNSLKAVDLAGQFIFPESGDS